MGFNVKALISVAVVFAAALPVSAQQVPLDALKGTYVRLANNANAVLWESPNPSPKSRIVIVNTHADHNNNFEYFIGRELATRGYRALNLNYYGPETEFEEFLAPIAAAVRYARSLPGVEKVVFATHSGGGPMLAFYQEVAEKGAAACQEPSRIYPCNPKGLENLPKVDGVLFLSANIGAPHRLVSLDPAVRNGQPRLRDPALDLYSPAMATILRPTRLLTPPISSSAMQRPCTRAATPCLPMRSRALARSSRARAPTRTTSPSASTAWR
jgi:hypothetical protein